MEELINIYKDAEMTKAILETVYMVLVSGIISFIVGLIIGILSFVTEEEGIWPKPYINKPLGFIINLARSIPFIILMLALTPVARFIVGKSYGPSATIISLTVAAIPFVGRLTEASLKEIDNGLTETAIAMGASPLEIICKVYLVESLPMLVRNFSLTLITLVGYSAMAGAVGGDGLGHVAIVYGYHLFDYKTMFLSLVLIVILVQIIQVNFELLARKIDKK